MSKTFRTSDGATVHALEAINLDVQKGEFVSLIGPSGCGKSTLLRIIADLIQPSSGAVTVNDKPAAQARKDQDYGFVFQSPTLYDWRTVIRNVQLPLEIMKYPRDKRDERARAMLNLVELGDFENKYPWQLSGGMQQRVSIARALSFEPQILLMDEPFGALDEMTRERMNNELLRIWGAISGMTVIFVTHSISEAVYLSSRVVVMSPRPGRIADVIDIDLPRPRGSETRDLDAFFHLSSKVRHALHAGVAGAEAGIE
jgi:NitT/TauT family transport system ATP-binding protein